ncbi:multiple monosaccharide ABC transporter ATP-binding protein [Anaerosphaera multitolerans]|uniref:Sugar ABC transporter ATP-binding protein n=1 Tax=Anaerosphaera multitolerans TaxID=2487351 RepID=A0A437S668_9FIRM|nr:multiple monosaccharide ABC transporter ATP-binding protein [Anaerosphaera multitolerans]RVU54467.1 sugar ABC transporter ATP-binding protein [Anaerosphaera multitolerans]
MAEYILQMKNITKEFPGVKALDDVNLNVVEGTIHAIVGENGAGKSTLMNILSGVYPYGTYSGDIVYEGEVCKLKNIKESEEKGIVIIHQELALVPNLSIKENIFLGNERSKKGIIDWNKTYKDAKKYTELVGLDEDLNVLVEEIGVGKQQLVEIAKALSKNVKLLILDEPTASLNDDDSEKLLDLILDLKKEGITSIIISHKLNEINKIADEITIIRDGKTIETLNRKTDDISEDRIIKGMVGREITDRYPLRDVEIGEVQFELKNWTVESDVVPGKLAVDNVSLYVRKGEVVGIAGLMGCGRTELAMSIFGKSYGIFKSGEIYKNGQKIEVGNPREAIDHKIAYVTEDRKTQGLILEQSIKNNITLPSLDKVSERGVINDNEELKVTNDYKGKINIKAPNVMHHAEKLSGGNQQKIMLARWIYADPDILILDEPTRGIDVGAKYEIYTIINELAAEGRSIIVISSEMPEVIGLSDRVYVMNEGRIVGELDKNSVSQENIMKAIMQSTKGE